MRDFNTLNFRKRAACFRPQMFSIQDRVHATLRAAHSDDTDTLLAIVARVLAARTDPHQTPGERIIDAMSCIDEIELLFSLELFSIDASATTRPESIETSRDAGFCMDPLIHHLMTIARRSIPAR
jgi:hypothetical protein